MRNVALIGHAGAGKTTIAKYLSEKYGYTPVSLSLGVKHIANAIFGIDPSRKTPRNRKILQEIGTKMREIEPNVWIRVADEFMDDMQKISGKDKFVIDDIRFLNEAEHYKKKGWVLIYLNCPYEVYKERLVQRDGAIDYEMFEHESEKQIEKIADTFYDVIYEIDASMELEDVLADVDEIVTQIESF